MRTAGRKRSERGNRHDGQISKDPEGLKARRALIPPPSDAAQHRMGVEVHNKLFEEEQLKEKAEVYEKRGYVMKPLATIPELDLTLYSRCLVCRMNADGTFASLEKEDFEKFIDYLAM